MIDLLFRFASEYVLVRIDGTSVLFANTNYGAYLAPLKNIKLSKKGIVKEFPDLKNNPDMERIAVQRFKQKIKGYETEKERAEYVIDDLRKHGYELKKKHVAGRRPENVR